nr:SMC family ATPase [Wenjunlia vitaminophila]
MRLHRLVISGFGPFAGTETVDFDALAEAGLFLVHGATGAGKTSVLDAVCFALYGKVPGARQGSALRSDHASPSVPTEVVLDFTVRGRRLEVTRRAPYRRTTSRGGSTTVSGQTLLREWRAGPPPGWTAISSSHQEVGAELELLLGMSREQFCQVVLLPQGDFAKFLRGDAKDRARLLGQLFDTGRFSAVERWLAERRLTTEKAARAAVDELLHTAHRTHQAAGSAERTPVAGSAPSWPDLVASVTTAAAGLRCDARERRDHAAIALASAERRHRAAALDAERVRALADRQSRAARARDRARELDAARQEMAEVADR